LLAKEIMILSRYQIFRAGLIAFLCGVALSYTGVIEFFDAYVLGIFFSVSAFFARKYSGIRTACILALFFSVGLCRVFGVGPEKVFSPPAKNFSFSAKVVQDSYFQRGKQIATLEVIEKDGISVGVLRATVPLLPVYHIGDTVSGTCSSLKKIQGKSGGIFIAPQSANTPLCTFATILHKDESAFSVRGTLSRVRDFFGAAIHEGMPSPQADLLSGLLIGAQGSFSSELATIFRRAGLSHIVAVSGSNISLVIAGLWSIFSRGRIGRRRSFWIIFFGVTFFVLLTGASSATVRSGIMGCLVLWAQYMGRLAQGGTALLLAAVIMVASNPQLLLFNVGFQLSCLATLGLMVYSPHIVTRLTLIPTAGGLRDIVAQTISALLFTTPLLITVFQTFSVVGFFANILVVPVIAPIMTLGFGWSVLAVVSFLLQHLFGFSTQWILMIAGMPLYGFLSYIVHTASLLSSFSFALTPVDFGRWTPLFFTASYIVIAAWMWRIRQAKA